MPNCVERRRVPYPRRKIFDLVADVENYPAFVPHLLASRVRAREGNTVQVEMLLGFGILRRRIRSIGVLSPPRRIDITSGDAPFRHFNLCWTFERLAATETLVELSADFELRFKLWQRLLAASFPLEVAAMADSFERRARQVYRDG